MGLHVHVFLIWHLRESTCHTYAYLSTCGKQLTGHVASWNRKYTSADWQLLFPHPVNKTAPKHTVNKKEMHFRAHTRMTRVKLQAIGWAQQGKAWLIGRLRTHRTCESKKSIHHTGVKIHSGMWWSVALRGSEDWEATRWGLRGTGRRRAAEGKQESQVEGEKWLWSSDSLTSLWELH